MITIVVRNEMHVDVDRDDAEWWPSIVSYGQDQAPRPMPLVTGATKAAEYAWDLVEAMLGHPAPGNAYRITISPAEPEDLLP